MSYPITKAERAVTLQLISTLKGVNRTDGRLIGKIEDDLRLGEVVAVAQADVDVTDTFDLGELEVAWILDHVNKAFEKSEMPPMMAKYALSLEAKLKDPKPD